MPGRLRAPAGHPEPDSHTSGLALELQPPSQLHPCHGVCGGWAGAGAEGEGVRAPPAVAESCHALSSPAPCCSVQELMQQASWNLCPAGDSSGCYWAADQTFEQLTGSTTVAVPDVPDGGSLLLLRFKVARGTCLARRKSSCQPPCPA